MSRPQATGKHKAGRVKSILPVAFIFMGSVFLLVSTVFFPAISQLLISLEADMDWAAPGIWNLPAVLAIDRIIFLIVGVFLTCFGIALALLKRHVSY